MDTEGPDGQGEDLQIEISDLKPRSSGRNVHVPWYRSRVELPRPLVAAGVVALVALAVLDLLPTGSALATPVARPAPAAITRASLLVATITLPTATPSPYPMPTPILPAIGFTPHDCPSGPALASFDPTVGPAVGGQDVWLTAHFIESGSALAIPLVRASGDYTPYGWPVEIALFIKPSLSGPVTLTGDDLHTQYALWLSGDDPNPQPAAPVMTIDPTQLQSLTSDFTWKIWFGTMYLPGAGCYALHSGWPGDSWSVMFAAGR